MKKFQNLGLGPICLCCIKKGDKADPQNYRGIALINAVIKLFTQIIHDRLLKWVTSVGILPEEHSGFRKGRGTMDNIYILWSAIHLTLGHRGNKIYGLFVDLKRAFDPVPHDIIWRKLYQIGISPKIIRIIKGVYDLATIEVRYGSGTSEKIRVTRGVLQREILSPLLFIIFLSDMVAYLRKKDTGGIDLDSFIDLILISYADDLVILAHSPVDLGRKLVILHDYCEENGITVNIDKS